MAKQFRFRLETVLKVKQQREDDRKRLVADRQREVRRSQERERQLAERIQVEIEAMRTSRREGWIDTGMVARHRHWLSHLNRLMLETEGETRTLQAKLAMERSQLAEASKERKILETLRDRQSARHAAAAARLERLEGDEIATMRYAYSREM